MKGARMQTRRKLRKQVEHLKADVVRLTRLLDQERVERTEEVRHWCESYQDAKTDLKAERRQRIRAEAQLAIIGTEVEGYARHLLTEALEQIAAEDREARLVEDLR